MASNAPYRIDRHRWNKLRARILRENPKCAVCFQHGRLRAAEELDHIVPLHKGGDWWARENLQPLCRRCHSKKTGLEHIRRSANLCRHGYRLQGGFECPHCSKKPAAAPPMPAVEWA